MMENNEAPKGLLNVAFVSDWLSARSRTKYSLDLAKALVKRNHTVKMIYPGGEMEELFKTSGIEIEKRRLISAPVANLLSLRGAARSVRQMGADVIHVLSQDMSVFGRRLAALSRLPYVVTVHTFNSSRKLAISKRARIVAVSEALREYLVNDFKISKKKIDVVPNGVDLSEYRATKLFARTNQVPVIGSLGRLDSVRGFEYFIKAAKTVVDAGHRVECLIVGTGEEEKRLRNLVSSLDLTECFTFVTESSNFNSRIESMDIVVVCPRKEGFGMVALEAMACGRPVIASAVGGIYGIVKDGETGLLVPPKDPDGIAERMISLLRNTEEAERLGRNARAMVEEEFTTEIVAEKTEAAYHRAIEG